jgi:hypothetical protein
MNSFFKYKSLFFYYLENPLLKSAWVTENRKVNELSDEVTYALDNAYGEFDRIYEVKNWNHIWITSYSEISNWSCMQQVPES